MIGLKAVSLQITVLFFGFEGVNPKPVPSKKPEVNKSTVTSASAPRTKTKTVKSKALAANGGSILNLAGALNGQVTPGQVAERAYFLWMERGCPVGTPEEDWLHAERELGVSR